MIFIPNFDTLLTCDSAKNVLKAVIVSVNLVKKGKEKRHFRTTKPRKMAFLELMTRLELVTSSLPRMCSTT